MDWRLALVVDSRVSWASLVAREELEEEVEERESESEEEEGCALAARESERLDLGRASRGMVGR